MLCSLSYGGVREILPADEDISRPRPSPPGNHTAQFHAIVSVIGAPREASLRFLDVGAGYGALAAAFTNVTARHPIGAVDQPGGWWTLSILPYQRSLTRMASIWVESLSRNFEQALDLLAAAVRDTPDELWEASMWQVPAPGGDYQFLGSDWNPIADAGQRSTLIERWVQRRSTPWSVAWHALEVFDYDLNGEFGPWTPPLPFAGHPHWRDLPSLPAAWSRSEIVGYIDNCRQRAHDTLEDMTDEKAGTLLPPAHRYQGQPYAWVLTGLVVHTTEHASQIRQFITAAGIALDAL